MDGFCGGAICYHFLKEKTDDITLIPHNYGNDLTPINDIEDGSVVFIVDYSLPVDVMKDLNGRTELVWLDHHASSLKDAERAEFDPPGIRRIGSSGCELAWEYFNPNGELPYIVKMLGRYDVWDLSYEPTTFWINTYLYGRDLAPGPDNAARWSQIFSAGYSGGENVVDETLTTEKIHEYGKLLYEFQLEQWKIESKSKCFEMIFKSKNEHSVLVCNGGKGSTFFHAMEPEKYDILMVFNVSKDLSINYSVYSLHDHIDVSLLAKLHGGGGHKGASGFKSDKFPWELPGMEVVKKEEV